MFQLPHIMHFGINFEISACVAIGLLFVINSVQAIGDFSATTAGGLDREPTTDELQGAIGIRYYQRNRRLLRRLPTATYSQNVGIVATTKVVNRVTLGISALVILVAGLFPKFSALLTTIPYAVLGGGYRIRVCLHRNDRYEAGYDGGNELPQHLHRWPRGRAGHGRFTGKRLLKFLPGMGNHHLRQVPGCNRNPGGHSAECDAAQGKEPLQDQQINPHSSVYQ